MPFCSVPSALANKSATVTPPSSAKAFLAKERLKSNRFQAAHHRNLPIKPRQPSAESIRVAPEEQSEDEEQDVKFINVSSARSQADTSSSSRLQEKYIRRINPEDVVCTNNY